MTRRRERLGVHVQVPNEGVQKVAIIRYDSTI
jgi:hypothetical protein